jgi:hypothetical protein
MCLLAAVAKTNAAPLELACAVRRLTSSLETSEPLSCLRVLLLDSSVQAAGWQVMLAIRVDYKSACLDGGERKWSWSFPVDLRQFARGIGTLCG